MASVDKPKVIAVMGTTGVGKSRLGATLATALGGEVVSCDSIQVYAGVPIASAAPSAAETSAVPHHLVGHVCLPTLSPGVSSPVFGSTVASGGAGSTVASVGAGSTVASGGAGSTAVAGSSAGSTVAAAGSTAGSSAGSTAAAGAAESTATYNVHRFVREARAAIADIVRRGKVPIVVGGTHYYMSALLVRPLPSDALIARVRDRPDTVLVDPSSIDLAGLPELDNAAAHAVLARVDPVMADRLPPAARRKVDAALAAIVSSGGVRHSDVVQEQRVAPEPPPYDTLFLWPAADKPVLHARIDARVDAMLRDGLVDELHAVAPVVLAQARDPCGVVQAIGLKEFVPYLEAAAANDPRAVDLLGECLDKHKRATRAYAGSQLRYITNNFVRRGVSVYRLDANNAHPDAWAEAVEAPALALATAFLAGTAAPPSLSPVPNDRPVDLDPKDLWTRHVCNACGGRVLHGAHQWDAHRKSRAHRRQVKRARRAAANPRKRPRQRPRSTSPTPADDDDDDDDDHDTRHIHKKR